MYFLRRLNENKNQTSKCRVNKTNIHPIRVLDLKRRSGRSISPPCGALWGVRRCSDKHWVKNGGWLFFKCGFQSNFISILHKYESETPRASVPLTLTKHFGARSITIMEPESTSPEDRALSPRPTLPGDLRHMTRGLRSPAVRAGVALRQPDPARLMLGMERLLEVLTHTKHGTRGQCAGLTPPQSPDKLLSRSHSRNRAAPQP